MQDDSIKVTRRTENVKFGSATIRKKSLDEKYVRLLILKAALPAPHKAVVAKIAKM